MTTRSRYTAAITDKPWWLAGGIPPNACVAAYQPKGASSLAASYVNLANPGVYDCTAGVAPGWAADTGWQFDGTTNSRYLTTGIYTPVTIATQSIIIKFSGASTVSADRTVIGACKTGAPYNGVIIQNARSDGKYGVQNGSTAYTASPTLASGILAASDSAYLNGVYKGALSPTMYTNAYQIHIGCLLYGSTKIQYFIGNVLSAAIYNIFITQSQVDALTNAMNAL